MLNLLESLTINTMANNTDKIQENIRSHLEDLLNTRARRFSFPSNLKELNQSVLTYGMSGSSHTNLSNHTEKQRLCEDIEKAIVAHEPRLKNINVTWQEGSLDNNFTLHIQASIKQNNNVEYIFFESQLDPLQQQFNTTIME